MKHQMRSIVIDVDEVYTPNIGTVFFYRQSDVSNKKFYDIRPNTLRYSRAIAAQMALVNRLYSTTGNIRRSATGNVSDNEGVLASVPTVSPWRSPGGDDPDPRTPEQRELDELSQEWTETNNSNRGGL